MPDFTVEFRDPNELKNHPLNAQIYGGDGNDAEFIASCNGGIETPLIILSDNRIISGHRRMRAARINNLPTVPVIVRQVVDALEIERLLIECNRQREKTTEQRAREYEHLKKIEEQRAEERQKANLKRGTVSRSGIISGTGKTSEKGESAQIAAAAVGMSAPTAEKALEVVEAIDAAEADGDSELTKTLRKMLNKNVAAAHRKATGKAKAKAAAKKPSPRSPPTP